MIADELDPRDPAVACAMRAIQALRVLERGKTDEALAVLRRAADDARTVLGLDKGPAPRIRRSFSPGGES